MSEEKQIKINDLSNSPLRKRHLEQEFKPETNFAVAMGRVSTKKQKGEGHFSDRAQLDAIEEYVEAENLVIIREPWDVAETASKHERRKNFAEMIAFVKTSQPTSKPVKHVVFSHQSRSNRNRDSARELEALLKLGVTLHFARDGRKLCSTSDLEELLLWDLNNILNEKFIKDHTKAVMGGTLKRVEQGLFPGKAPFGYRNYRESENKLSVFRLEPRESTYVLRAFEEYSTGLYSEESLRQKLNAEFIDIRRLPGKQQFSHILQNPFYYGDFTYSGAVYHGHPEYQPRLLTFQLWNQVQEVMNQPSRNRMKVTKRQHAYLGMIKCGGRILDSAGNETEERCDCLVTAEEKRKVRKDGSVKIYIYWHCGSVKKCSQRSRTFMDRHGLKPNMQQEDLESLLGEVFAPLKFKPDVVKWMQDTLLTEHAEKKVDHKQEVASLLRRREMLQTMMSRAYEDKLVGVISEDAWKETNAKWLLESEQLLQRIEVLDGVKQDYIARGVELIELVQNLEKIYENATPEKKRRALEIVSSNFVLANGKLCFDYRKPFDVLVESGGKEKWLGR